MGTAAIDINLGCSGYVYGLAVAYSMVANSEVRKLLLLNGESITRSVSQRDKTTGLLFGDSGTATLLEKTANAGSSVFSLFSDGGRGQMIMAPAGGYRNPSSESTVVERRYQDGSIRSEEHTVMDGAGVFSFVISDVYKDIAEILARTKSDPSSIDYFVFHQANRFATEHLRKKLKISSDKVPYSLDEFGNTSGPSIPLTMVTRLASALRQRRLNLLLAGFGVGLSWGTAVLATDRVHVCDLVEVGEAS
jgi:3-oxoacyl-[acyl-carrier-protein] synthase-3